MSRFCSGVARDRDCAGSPHRVAPAEKMVQSASTGELLAVSIFLIYILLSSVSLSKWYYSERNVRFSGAAERRAVLRRWRLLFKH